MADGGGPPPVPGSGQGVAEVAVIGAGGAGLLAGIAAAKCGARPVLYERMKAPAKKVAISGGGRCNYSNTLDPPQFVRLFGDRNSSQLGHALRAFSREDLESILSRYGVEGQVERNYRLYTRSGRGADVVQALVQEYRDAGGELVVEARITSLARDPERMLYRLGGDFAGVPGERLARTVVVSTGGLSYPATGSSGDGYAWARGVGHGVTDLRAALVGLTLEEEWPRKLSGVAWPDAEATLWPASETGPPAPGGPQPGRGGRAAKPLAVERAEILFTHFGISGPAILDVSNAFIRSGLSRASLRLDLFPDLSREALDARLTGDLRRFPVRSVARGLEGLLPARLLDRYVEALGAEGDTPAGQLARAARLRLVELLKETCLTVTGTRALEYGEVTAGGVEWGDIDPATMESRLSPGLFFAGEILDLAGRCGGFNLQAAFSTGFLAGRSAALRARGAS